MIQYERSASGRRRTDNALDSSHPRPYQPRRSFNKIPRGKPVLFQHRQDDSQESLTLNPAVIASSFSDDGQNPPVKGQTGSLTSQNNFINFCALFKVPLTNGLQLSNNASCNPVPIGVLPSADLIPSSKFRFPLNGDILQADIGFSVSLKINNLNTGVSISSLVNFLSAPQQLDDGGKILGHSAVVIEQLSSFQQTGPTSPSRFAFYKGLTIPSQAGVVSADVDGGLAPGFYRLSSITTSVNHASVQVPELAHGAIDDAVYFTVTTDGNPPGKSSLGSGSGTATDTDFSVDLSRTGKTSQQSSNTVDASVIGNFTNPGGGDGFANSLTSTNNYINYCLNSPALPLTNGQISSSSSCNPAPMGMIVPPPSMPSAKFISPRHLDSVPANSSFTVQVAVSNIQSGVMTNSAKTYLSAPQQIDGRGRILGHAHIVIEELTDLRQDIPTDPRVFAFFAELGEPAENGVLETNVTGLPDGIYRLSVMQVAANHQQVIVGQLQHGSLNDVVYFTVGNGGNGTTSANTLNPDTIKTSTSNEPSPTNTGSGDTAQPPSGRPNLGAAVGGAAAGIVVLILLLVGLVLYRRRRRLRNGTTTFTIDGPATYRESGLLASQITPFPSSAPASTASSSAALVPNASAQSHIPPVPLLFPVGREKQQSTVSPSDTYAGSSSRSKKELTATSPSQSQPQSSYGSSSGMSPTQTQGGSSNQDAAGASRTEHTRRSRRRSVVSELSLAPSYHTTA
ncbi:hypothetical protein VKT23_005134 [Stygiomarasmius scandens]|uniref:Uncharacterized protein n=1 Tax=Marasmiellus scandens TaxID=2682957 RepID=A0ABR1JWS6_9AGAR